MIEKRQIKPIDIREFFEKGKRDKRPMISGAARVAEAMYDIGIILGNAINNVPEQRKIK